MSRELPMIAVTLPRANEVGVPSTRSRRLVMYGSLITNASWVSICPASPRIDTVCVRRSMSANRLNRTQSARCLSKYSSNSLW